MSSSVGPEISVHCCGAGCCCWWPLSQSWGSPQTRWECQDCSSQHQESSPTVCSDSSPSVAVVLTLQTWSINIINISKNLQSKSHLFDLSSPDPVQWVKVEDRRTLLHWALLSSATTRSLHTLGLVIQVSVGSVSLMTSGTPQLWGTIIWLWQWS